MGMGERARELIILIIGDVVVFNLALWLTLFLRYFEFPSAEVWGAHLSPFLIFSGVWILVFYTLGLYDKHTNLLKNLLVSRILSAQIINGLLAVVLFFVVSFGIAPKTNLIIYLIISTILLTVWRLYLVPRFSHIRRRKAILIANGEEAIELADEINNNDRYSYYFIRIIDENTLKNTNDFESRIKSLMARERVEIIVADPQGEEVRSFLPVLFDLSFLRFACVFLDFNRLYEDTFDRVPVGMLRYEWFINNISQSSSVVYDALKRALDIVGAVILLVPTAVLLPFIAIAIKLEDKGPLLYSTERVGQYNRLITIYKFRTKNGVDAGKDALKSELLDTRIGRWLRKLRLDELPQLVNVLKGDLSFIGPRPEMPALAEVYAKEIPYYNTRHFLKPGLSGWAQINNFDVPRGGVDVPRTITKLSYDLYYLERRSLLLDIQIALKTLATIIMRTGT